MNARTPLIVALTLSTLSSFAFALPAADQAPVGEALDHKAAATWQAPVAENGFERTPLGQTVAENGFERTPLGRTIG